MESALERLLSAIPAAAASPLALVAYVLAVAAWLLVALRVKRNRQVISALRLIPSEERVRLLESEMGITRLRAGLDPETWLRSRVHMYYLVGFIVTCAAVVVVVAIAFWSKPVKTAGESTSSIPAVSTLRAQQQLIYTGSANHPDELDILPYIKLGAARRFIEYHAGPPQFEDVVLVTEHENEIRRAAYTFPKYYLVVTYNPDDEVVQYGVTIRDESLRVPLPWPSSNKLGDETFGNACGVEGCSPSYFNVSAREWIYIESVWYAGYMQNRAGFIAYTDYGAEFVDGAVVGAISKPIRLEDVLLKVTSSDRTQLTNDELRMLKVFRARSRPNAYGETTIDFPELRLQESVVDYSLSKQLGQ